MATSRFFTLYHPDETTVAVFETDSERFVLVVGRDGCEQKREISYYQAQQFRDENSVTVENYIIEMKAELERVIQGGQIERQPESHGTLRRETADIRS